MAAPGPAPAQKTAQLNVRVDLQLAARLRQRARELHSSPGALVAQALEQFLDGNHQQGGDPVNGDLASRLEELEARVASLEAEKPSPGSQ
jgi:hypothetical protein